MFKHMSAVALLTGEVFVWHKLMFICVSVDVSADEVMGREIASLRDGTYKHRGEDRQIIISTREVVEIICE